MPWTTLHLTVATPLFSGDDPNSDGIDSPVRVPSIRGVLRFWFRALAAGHGITQLPTLWEQEKAVFGSTTTPSPIALRIRRQPAATGKASRPGWAMHPPSPRNQRPDQRFRGAQYLLGQGLWSYQTGLTRSYVRPGETVELDIRFSADETVNARFLLALWAWLTYGGLGARTRRGFGQLRCTAVDGALPGGWTARHLAAPASKRAWQELGERGLPADLPGSDALGWPDLVTDQPDQDAALPEFPALCPRWWCGVTMGGAPKSLAEAMHVAGRELRLFRAADPRHTEEPQPDTHSPEWLNVINGTDQRYPIAALGLPVGYFSPAKDDRAEVKAKVDPRDDTGPLRRASPLWLRPVALSGGTWTVFTHVFWARLLPAGARLVVSGPGGPRTLPVPGRDIIERAWDAWLDNEDRLPADYYPGS